MLADKEAIAKILTYDSFGSIQYSASDIESVSYKGDILRFNLSGNRATMLSVDQLFYYHQQIMDSEKEIIDAQEIDNNTVVELAKEIGTVIWESGCKLGYVVRYRSWFYAVTEVLTTRGFQYSHSRHGSFYLAQEELRERSWEVGAALEVLEAA
ncbi:hypothetical protein [Planktothrix sp.]|uniref:hypothetical protein n=1 Tax=Planktothrix sp. TaxID=3088171 RepID=UPI0038D389F7